MREGKFGVIRPFGDILSEYRPLIPERFADAPEDVAAVATTIDESEYTKKTMLSNVTGGGIVIKEVWPIDFVLDVEGVDMLSTSSIGFNEDAEFLGGAIRVGTIQTSEHVQRYEVNRWFTNYITETVQLEPQEDDLRLFVRERHKALTPHIIFTSRRPDSETSPLTTAEVLEVIERIGKTYDESTIEL